MLKTNEGTNDRTMRVILGVVIVSMVFVGPKTPWAWLGLIPIATGLSGWCPLYTVLGINTCSTR